MVIFKRVYYQSVILVNNGEVDMDLAIAWAKELFGHELKIDKNLSITVAKQGEKKSIGIKEIAELKTWNSTKNESGKIALILEADLLTVEAQNSLLKVIEEPTENNILILQTENPFNLLETIRSRCNIVDKTEKEEYKGNVAQSYFETKGYVNRLNFLEQKCKEWKELQFFLEEAIKHVAEDKTALKKQNLFDNMVELLDTIASAIRRKANKKLIYELINLTFKDI